MKTYKLIILLITGFCPVLIFAQSSDQNYIKTTTYLNETGTDSLNTIRYYDGLGRPIQTVLQGITPGGSDLITYQEYDRFGRDSTAWLPAVAANNNGAFVDFAAFSTKSANTYNTTTYNSAADTKPYSLPVYEPSPLNRIVQQFGSGQAWQNNNKAVETDYKTNNITDNALKCNYYFVSGNNLVRDNLYATGQLYVTETKDEDGKKMYRFTDKLGRVVMTRQLNSTTNHDTYYVYDDFGNQRYMLPPLAADSLPATGTWNVSDQDANGRILRNYAYIYKYDSRNRCIEKKLPGCEPIYMVYDKADRLVLSQDGVQRSKEQWTVMKYDVLGRLLYTGLIDREMQPSDIATVQDNVITEEFAHYYGFAGTGYSCNWFTGEVSPSL